MSRLATFMIAILDAIRALFSPASPPDPLAPRDPGTPAAPGPRPISPAVRSFILDGHTPQDQVVLEQQISDYEAAGQTSYTLRYPGGYYLVKDGQVVGSGREEV
jgi:hypothetical protein